MSDAGALVVAPPRVMRREAYDGPGTGLAYQRTEGHDGPREREVTLTVNAAEPGQGAAIGDVWLTVQPRRDGRDAGVALRFRLDIGAKRFLFSQLEQALTIGDFQRGV